VINVSNERVLGYVPKNRMRRVRVSVGDFRERPFVYIVTCPLDEPEDGKETFYPGVTLQAESVRKLIPLLEQAITVAEERDDGGWKRLQAECRRGEEDGR